MIDIKKILDIVDSGQEAFIAREDKPIVVVMSMDKYESLKDHNKPEEMPINNQIALGSDYANRVRKSLLD